MRGIEVQRPSGAEGFRRFKGFLRLTALKAGGFSGLMGLWPEGCGIALAVHSEHI